MLLERLCNACGIPGREDEVRDLLRQALTGHVDEIWTDSLGNLLVRKGSGPYKVMLDAHMDEVGFCVGEITAAGYLKLKKVGGVDDRVIPGRHVWVTERRIPGVVGARAFHLTGSDERSRVISLDQMSVDLGCSSRAQVEEMGIELGDPVYFAAEFEMLGETMIRARALDDRAGCAAIAEVLLNHSYPGITLFGAFTVQEEVGLRGARAAAYNLNPDLALAMECTPAADLPDTSPIDTATHVGAGPVIYLLDHSGIPNRAVAEQLAQVAGTEGIPFQFKRTAVGGTDAGAIALQREGIPACPVSLPARYLHTGASMASLEDYRNLVRLLDGFLRTVERGEFRP